MRESTTQRNPGVFGQGMSLVGRSWRLRPLGHLLATTGAVLYGVASVGLTVVLGRVTDDVIVPGFTDGGVSREAVWLAVLAFLVVGSARAAGAMGRRWFQSWAEFGTQQVWRNQLLDRYLDVPMSFHHRTPAGRLLAHADADVESATRMLKPLAFAMGTLAMAVAALTSLLLTNVYLALVAIVLFPLLSILNRVYTSKVSALAIEEREIVGEVSSITHESFDGALVVKTLGREAAEVQRIDEASERLLQVRIRIGRIRGTFEPILEALPNIGIVALILVGSWLVGSGSISTGDLVQAMAIFTILALPVRIVGFFLQELPSSVAALARVDAVLDEAVESKPASPATLPAGALGVEMKAVRFGYADQEVLRGIDATFHPGESVAIVGSTGSGKSTIGHLLTRLVTPDSGSITVGGIELNQLSMDATSDAISIVFQEAFLFADTIRQNVTLGDDFSDEQIEEALRLTHADGFVADLATKAEPSGMDTVVGERGVSLSGGQRQRIALARALIRRPRVLILDDATSAVDPTIEAGILSALRQSLDTTLIMIAYRLATIRVADRVLYVSDGRVVRSGLHSELMDDDDYSALIRAYEEASDAARS